MNDLCARFNPEGSLLRKHQHRMLAILQEVDTICKKHEIPYWLSSGTLIGAARHQGFIPWDDDLDIEMLRQDYERLMHILPTELPDWLALQEQKTDPNYYYFYAKIRDRHSHLSEVVDYDRVFAEQGIYIDIFPLEMQSLWLHRISEIAQGHVYKIMKRRHETETSKMKKVRFITRFNHMVTYPILRLVNHFPGRILTSGLGVPFHNPRYMNEIFPLTKMTFEGQDFPAPGNTDAYLRRIYGDYMQLPNLDTLQTHIQEITIDANGK